MTRFEELLQAQQAAFGRLIDYQTECYTFAEKFFSAMRQYFSCPDDSIKFYVLEDTIKEATLAEAIYLQDDGFFTINFSFSIKSAAIEDRVVIPVRLKESESRFIVRIGRIRREYEFSATEIADDIYHYIFTEIKHFYDSDGYIIKKSSNPIGFMARNNMNNKEIVSIIRDLQE